MSTFERVRITFRVNWTTVLVGWKGLGVFSPWPERQTEFPPLLSASEIAAYADERLVASSDPAEIDLLEKFLLLDLQGVTREMIESLVNRLSDLESRDEAVELRKWRAIRLGEVLEVIPDDPIYGLIALTEFWQEFGFPPDSPHEVQGKDISSTPSEYYRPDNWARLLNIHKEWLKGEIVVIKSQSLLTREGSVEQ